ncbi:DUF6308 family protein [Georgenia phoenicis]|uniref:DUF6308 family protein n=1 Tax=unclassified Georgenia TaxID=2626815 RepID=UPI0039B0087B
MPVVPEILKRDNRENALALLRRYFGLDGKPAYSGSRFEALGGGGDAADVADKITAVDIVALSMLSIAVPGTAALRLLEDDEFVAVTGEYLSKLPTDVDLVDIDREVLVDGPAASLWRHFRQLDGVGPTTTSKLMARKRPRLIPVYDSVIERAFHFENSSGHWEYWHDLLNADGRRLHTELLNVRADAGLPEAVSALRVLDVVVWMGNRRPDEEGEEASLVTA